jgi:ATP-binding cassette subfamily F protein uup
MGIRMALLRAQDLTVSFSGPPLLDGVRLTIDDGERVALVGRNGSGKSTLLKTISGDLAPDSGTVDLRAGASISRLSQEAPPGMQGEIFDVVAGGAQELGALVAEYHRLSHTLGDGTRDLELLADVQHRLEAAGGWQLNSRVEATLSRLGLPDEGRFETLSGGLQRRVLLARTLVSEPDLLLLDEPTNHLDIEAIEWLEEMLLGLPTALVFVTHDRSFMRRLATRIVELDRGRLTSYPGDYRRYLERIQSDTEIEARHTALQDKKLAREEAWVREGIKARRTRNEGRVRALERLREEVKARRTAPGAASLRYDSAERSGKMVIEARGVGFRYEAVTPIVDDFSLRIMRGDKIGILGPNGSGKSTLLALLLGRREPDVGSVRHGARLEIAYFDQHREQLDPRLSVADNLANGDDHVMVGGKRRHVIGYLESFLFPPDRSRSPIDSLSGGERNRLLLARLFTRPFNLLVMDEPTNDLDVETLELLEARLVEFDGTLLLVSHDRAFLDNTVTSTLVMEGGGRVGMYAGGYSDWLLQRPPPPPETAPSGAERAAARAKKKEESRSERKRKLTHREVRDLEALPGQIEALETEQSELHTRAADPDLYRNNDKLEIRRIQDRLSELEVELAAAYERWGELESVNQ